MIGSGHFNDLRSICNGVEASGLTHPHIRQVHHNQQREFGAQEVVVTADWGSGVDAGAIGSLNPLQERAEGREASSIQKFGCEGNWSQTYSNKHSGN